MATFTWTGQGTDGATNTVVGATDVIRFSGATFATPVVVGSYQDTTHVENSGGAEQCATIHLHNLKYISSGNFSLDGGGSTALSASVPTTANCTLKINFSDGSSVVISAGLFYAYDGSTTTAVPTGVTFQCFERSNTVWTGAMGSASALSLAGQSTNTSHDFFLGLSATPTSVGEKTAFKLRIELTYA